MNVYLCFPEEEKIYHEIFGLIHVEIVLGICIVHAVIFIKQNCELLKTLVMNIQIILRKYDFFTFSSKVRRAFEITRKNVNMTLTV